MAYDKNGKNGKKEIVAGQFKVCTPIKIGEGDDEKTYWHTIGRMFQRKDGNGFLLALNSLPLSPTVMCFPVEERE